jgi:uncharacterized protein YndB with AHSA1/START domain
VTAHRVGDAIQLELDGEEIAVHYIEIDPPHRMLLRWDRQGSDRAAPKPTFVDVTFTPTSNGTNVKVQYSGESPEDVTFYRQHWARHLDQIASAFASAESAQDN